MSDLVVREAELGDLEALLALYAELMAGDRPGAQPGDRAGSMPPMEAILADPARHLLVGAIGGEALGTVDLLIAPNLTHRGEPWAIIENVVVAARARRRGLGRALMSAAIEIARAAGCYKVQLLSGNERSPAHEFYRGLGMQPRAQGFKIYLDGSSAEPGG